MAHAMQASAESLQSRLFYRLSDRLTPLYAPSLPGLPYQAYVVPDTVDHRKLATELVGGPDRSLAIIQRQQREVRV